MATKTPKNKTPKNATDNLLAAIQAMSEATFTNKVVEPLFRALEYRVDYNGGPLEGGKDVICWKEGIFGATELAVIQVKKTTASAAAGSSTSFSGIINQLQQAAEKEVPNLTGQKQRPNQVFFITPYAIETRALESRFEAVQTLATRGVRVLDGRLICEALVQRLPKLANELSGNEFVLHEPGLAVLSNADLLSALNYSKQKSIADFYCDLDFGVGKVTTKMFFSMDFDPHDQQVSMDVSRWSSLEEILSDLEQSFKTQFTSPNSDDIRKNYEAEISKWASVENQRILKTIKDSYEVVRNGVGDVIDDYSQIIADLMSVEIVLDASRRPIKKTSKEELTSHEVEQLSNLKGLNAEAQESFELWRYVDTPDAAQISNITMTLELLEKNAVSFESEKNLLGKSHVTMLEGQLHNIETLRNIINDIAASFLLRAPEPLHRFVVHGELLVNELLQQRAWITEGVRKLSSGRQGASEIRSFFVRCQGVYELLGRIFSAKRCAFKPHRNFQCPHAMIVSVCPSVRSLRQV
jgi:hypothetical protein